MDERSPEMEALSDALHVIWCAHATLSYIQEGKHKPSAFFCDCASAEDYKRILNKYLKLDGGGWHHTMPGE